MERSMQRENQDWPLPQNYSIASVDRRGPGQELTLLGKGSGKKHAIVRKRATCSLRFGVNEKATPRGKGLGRAPEAANNFTLLKLCISRLMER